MPKGGCMNIFNKIIVVATLVFLAFISLFSMVNEFVDAGIFKWSDIAMKIFNPEVDIPLYISSFALLMVFIICVFLLVLEFYRRKSKVAIISGVKAGKAMITLESIAQQIKDKVTKVDGVGDVRATARPKSNGIIIDMLVELNLDVNIPEKMQEIIDKASDVASDKLGVKVINTKLTIVSLAPERKEKLEEIKEDAAVDKSQEDTEE
jgi:uncharacterized alkaline shock family protein YloU